MSTKHVRTLTSDIQKCKYCTKVYHFTTCVPILTSVFIQRATSSRVRKWIWRLYSKFLWDCFLFIWSYIDVLSLQIITRIILSIIDILRIEVQLWAQTGDCVVSIRGNEITPDDVKLTRCKQNDYSPNQGFHSWHEKEALNTEYLNRLKFNHTRNLNS